VLSETGEGKVFEEWVGGASVFGFEILPQPSENSALKNLDGALHNDGSGCTLLVGWEVKIEVPAYTASRSNLPLLVPFRSNVR
jgi:hypothetical protein